MRMATKNIYKQTKKIFLIGVLLISIGGNAQSSRDLDSILTTLKNNELYVAPVIRGVWLFPVTASMQKERTEEKKPSFVVSSLDTDIRNMATIYTNSVLSQKLYVLLADPERNFYANALLYDLLDNRKLVKLFGVKREEWINSGKQKCDMEFWKNYFNAIDLLNDNKPVNYY